MDSYQHGARTQLSARVALCLAAAGFFSVPLVTAFVMSGKAENSVKAVSAIFLILPAFIVAAAFKDRIIASGIAVIAVCTFLAYVSSTLEYTSGSRYAGEIAELFGGRPLALEGYVEKADALPGNSMFIRIEKIDGKELEKPVSAYTYNRTGHYFCEGLHISFNAGLRLPENSESRDDNFDFVSWLKGKGVYLEVYDVSEFAAEASDGQVSSLRSALTDRVFSGVDSALSLIPDTDVYLRSRAMSRALMFGETSGFEDQDLDNFSRSGVTHILSVSGIHFSVVLGALGSVLRIVIRRKKPRLVILAAFSAVYLYLCAFTASALRAAIMAFIASTGIAGDGKNKTSLSLLATVSVNVHCKTVGYIRHGFSSVGSFMCRNSVFDRRLYLSKTKVVISSGSAVLGGNDKYVACVICFYFCLQHIGVRRSVSRFGFRHPWQWFSRRRYVWCCAGLPRLRDMPDFILFLLPQAA